MSHSSQRAFYAGVLDADLVYSICKAKLRHQMGPKRLSEVAKANVPFVLRWLNQSIGPRPVFGSLSSEHARRVFESPSLVESGFCFEKPVAPQRAQHVKFVGRSNLLKRYIVI
jgi:hypothetical protein